MGNIFHLGCYMRAGVKTEAFLMKTLEREGAFQQFLCKEKTQTLNTLTCPNTLTYPATLVLL